jgi:hypothetical protein
MPRRGAYSITPVAGYNVCWQAPAIGDEQVPLAGARSAVLVVGGGEAGCRVGEPRFSISQGPPFRGPRLLWNESWANVSRWVLAPASTGLRSAA